MLSAADLPAVRGETMVLKVHKQDKDVKVGIDLGYSKDHKWLVIAEIHRGTLCDVFSELKPGAKLIDIKANGDLYRQPTLQQAIVLMQGAVGDLELTVMPLLDRYGFIISTDEFMRSPVTRDMLRYENHQLSKWMKRAATPQAWQSYAERKPRKLRARIRSGVPEAVRGFVWKLMAAGRAPVDFRQEGLYFELASKESGEHTKHFAQIDKDVPRTMTEHVYFRSAGKDGQEALTRVLRAYAAFHPALGYTQGMSSYAAVLVLYMTEEDAFWTFATLMQHCGLAGLFTDGFPYLNQCYDIWQGYLRRHLPRLDKHITKEICDFLSLEVSEYKEMVAENHPQKIMVPSMYTTYWFQTMLVGGDAPAPNAVAPRLMDSILLDGSLAVLFQLGLALLKSNERALTKKKGEALAEALKLLPKNGIKDIDVLLAKAFDYHVDAKTVQGTKEVV